MKTMIKNSLNLFIFLLVLLMIIIPPISASTKILEEIDIFLESNLGKDFIENYIGEPIINPVLDPEWNSYDIEKAKEFLNKDLLPSAEKVIIYPMQIDGVESSFRVIGFSDGSFYSELTSPVNVEIRKEQATQLAKEEGIEEPYNIILMTNDQFFGWNIISTKNPDEMKEGEIFQVTIDLRSNNISSNVFSPIDYNEDSNSNMILITSIVLIAILLAIIIIVYNRRKKNDKED